MMTAGARQRRRGRPLGTVTRSLLPLVLVVSVTVLFAIVWQSVGEQSAFATLERNGVRYLQALEPLEIALTNAQATAVNGGTASRESLTRTADAVTVVDNELREQLGTQDRWAGLRTKIEALPTDGAATAVIAAYSGADDLLLALMDKVRNSSKLIRDPTADTYYLEDGAAQELPEGIVAAAQYTDLLVSVAGASAADQAKALVDINSARSDLVSNAHDLSDDVRLAVEGTGIASLGGALLKKLDRFNQSIDNLVPLMSTLVSGKGGIDTAKVVRARDEMQSAAVELSAALLTEIDGALGDRLSSLSQRRLLAIATIVAPVLLAIGMLVAPRLRGFAPTGLTRAARRRRGTVTAEKDGPEALPQGPAHEPPPQPVAVQPVAVQPVTVQPATAQPATVPPEPWPVQPLPAQWPEPGPHEAANPQYARWERFGAPQ